MGIEAFSVLIPADWQFSGGINWLLDNPGMPATARFRVTAPDGSGEFEVFPNQPFFWSNNQMLLSTFPIGSRCFGNEVHPPLGPLPALKEIVIPRFRGNVRDLRIVSEENLPDLVKELGAGGDLLGGGLDLRRRGPGPRRVHPIRNAGGGGYLRGGGVGTVPHPGHVRHHHQHQLVCGLYLLLQGPERNDRFPSPRTLQTIARSFRINPRWLSKYNQLVEQLIQAQIRQIHNVGELSRIIARTSDEISDMSMQAYNQRQAVNDRIADNFSRYVRGVDAYYDPVAEKQVDLPSGYDNAWTNSLGEYILSEDPSYNPNIGSNLNWEPMKRKQE